MAQAMIMPKKYFFDKDGNPLAFGKVYTYLAGTTTNQPTFTTENGDVANTNPVILNGEGYATIYLDGSYKIVVHDINDNLIWSEDPVTSGAAGGSSNAFDSLDEAITEVSLSPGDYSLISTASNKTKQECDDLGVSYPDKGGSDYFIVTGIGDGYLNHSLSGGYMLKLNHKGTIHVEQAGAISDFYTGTNYNLTAADNKDNIEAILSSGVNADTAGGAYGVSTCRFLEDGASIIGGGTIGRTHDSTATATIRCNETIKNCKVKGITVDGNGANRSGTKESSYEIVGLLNSESFVVENNQVINAYGNGIGAYSCKGMKILNNYVIGSGVNSILSLRATTDLLIDGNYTFDNKTQNGIFVSSQVGQGANGVIVSNNIVDTSADFGIEIGHTDGAHYNVTCTGNTVKNSNNAGISMRGVYNGVINGNAVLESGASSHGGSAIFCSGDFEDVKGLVISNNTIKPNAGIHACIHITSYSEVVISGNTVTGNASLRGIYLEGDSNRTWSDVVVSGNFVADVGKGLQGWTNTGSDPASNAQITGNSFVRCTSYGVEVTTSVNDLTVSDNSFIDCRISANFFQTNNLILSGNRSSGATLETFILANTTDYSVVGNNIITAGDSAIFLQEDSNGLIDGNSIKVTSSANAISNVVFSTRGKVRITNNILESVATCINLVDRGIVAKGNSITSESIGVRLYMNQFNADFTDISNNLIHANTGITVKNTNATINSVLSICDNVIYGFAGGAGGYGIEILGDSNVAGSYIHGASVKGNDIYNMKNPAISAYRAHNCSVMNNSAYNCAQTLPGDDQFDSYYKITFSENIYAAGNVSMITDDLVRAPKYSITTNNCTNLRLAGNDDFASTVQPVKSHTQTNCELSAIAYVPLGNNQHLP